MKYEKKAQILPLRPSVRPSPAPSVRPSASPEVRRLQVNDYEGQDQTGKPDPIHRTSSEPIPRQLRSWPRPGASSGGRLPRGKLHLQREAKGRGFWPVVVVLQVHVYQHHLRNRSLHTKQRISFGTRLQSGRHSPGARDERTCPSILHTLPCSCNCVPLISSFHGYGAIQSCV
jgi:hypothetical protein